MILCTVSTSVDIVESKTNLFFRQSLSIELDTRLSLLDG